MIYRTLSFILFMQATLHCSYAPSSSFDKKKFQQAREAYEQQEYTQALLLYSALEPKTSAVWYNMGHCFYQKEQYTQAISCWKQVPKNIAYSDYISAQKNIANAYSRLQKIPPLPWYHFFALFLEKIIWWLSLGWAQCLILIAWFITCFCIAHKPRPFLLTCLGTATFFSCLLLCVWLFHEYNTICTPQGLISSDQAPIHLIAHDSSHIIGHQDKAATVKILNEEPGWYKIKAGKQVGWVQACHVIKQGSVPLIT